MAIPPTSEVLAIEAERPNSVKITSNFKGELAYEVKGYGETLKEAREETVTQFKELRIQVATIR